MKSFSNQILLAVLLSPILALGQSTSDILEHGIRVDQMNEVRLKLDNGALKFKSVHNSQSSYISLDDAAYYISGDKVNIYINVLNPLNYSLDSKVTLTDDALSKAEDDALKTLISQFSGNKKGGPYAQLQPLPNSKAPSLQDQFQNLQDNINTLKNLLQNDNKKKIGAQFSILKGISFENLPSADGKITSVKAEIEALKTKYNDFKNKESDIQTGISSFIDNNKPLSIEASLASYSFNEQFIKIDSDLQTQLKWLANLINAYQMITDARNGGVTIDNELVTQVTEVAVNAGKISNLSITINQDGLKLTETNDIVVAEKKSIASKVLRFRKFKRFVFEMAGGVAFTLLDYPKFGTATDASGKTIVADAGTESFKRFNITAMFNWNLYIPKTNIHPFFQIGLGANAEYPVLFTGMGLRINSEAKSHFAVSWGLASSWIKTLNNLKIGSVINGSSDLEKDITYEFKWPAKFYIGIQYNF